MAGRQQLLNNQKSLGSKGKFMVFGFFLSVSFVNQLFWFLCGVKF